MKTLPAFAAAVLGLALTAPVGAQKPEIADGKPFPNIAFPSLEDGSPMSLADFRGKKVLLHFFASWCGGCRMIVPGWHEATRDLMAEGEIRTVGIIQEQHPDRCRLFMQWKEMGWPIMVDSLNELEVQLVPITALIDEHGVAHMVPRRRGMDMEKVVRDFIEMEFPPPDADLPGETTVPSMEALRNSAEEAGTVQAWRDYGEALVKWGGPRKLGEAIEAFHQAIDTDPESGIAHFQLGVAYRKRYDSDQRLKGDFGNAVNHWQKALDLDPNQYIWRRRIEQYGPRLMKPYSFYDWVHEAREAIRARGEEPVELSVEPSGAEFAYPEREFTSAGEEKENPDPEGRIHRDQRQFIKARTVVVPSEVQAGNAVRIHVEFTPNDDPSILSHWNNEVGGTAMWIDTPEGWNVDRRYLTAPRPKKIVSTETRRIEFELQVPEDAEPGVHAIPAYALYYVCEDVEGKCLYRRQDLEIEVNVVE